MVDNKTEDSTDNCQSVLKRMVIRRAYDDEKYQYMVEDEEGKYVWGCRKDAVLFEYFDAKKNQQMLDFNTFLEVL